MKNTDLIALFERSLRDLPEEQLQEIGTVVRVAVLNAAGVAFQAGVGQTILFGGAASTVGGTLTSVTVGSTATVTLVNATTWVTEAFTGAWVPA